MDKVKLDRSYQSLVNNAQGHHFESAVKAGCTYYKNREEAEIEKTPEPFRVIKKNTKGIFTGRFTGLAQPDFQGTLKGGQSICFEAKYTMTNKMQRNVLSDNQMDLLESHDRLGAKACVCIGIKDDYFFIPWNVWRDMKEIYGRQYVNVTDIESYRVIYDGSLKFLDYVHKEGR